ncbi:hypothetical protein ACHAWF_000897 [Thalassiosira exigua]
MVSSEGSREIEAVRQRLAAAKAQVSSASKMMAPASSMRASSRTMVEKARAMTTMGESMRGAVKDILDSATKMADMADKDVDVAQEQLDLAKKEVEKANASLKDAEKRWEVIDIDDDDANVVEVDDDDAGSNAPHQNEGTKKRKASSSSTSITVTAAVAAASTRARVKTNGQREANANPSETIFLEECGTPGANDAYKLDKARNCGLSPFYCKAGLWEGGWKEFSLFFTGGSWYIGVGPANIYPREKLYRTINRVRTPMLSMDWEWKPINRSASPAPKLRFDEEAIADYCRNKGLHPFGNVRVDLIVLMGVKVSEVNGNYKEMRSPNRWRSRVFQVMGQWKGKWGDFLIRRVLVENGSKYWCITHETHEY